MDTIFRHVLQGKNRRENANDNALKGNRVMPTMSTTTTTTTSICHKTTQRADNAHGTLKYIYLLDSFRIQEFDLARSGEKCIDCIF